MSKLNVDGALYWEGEAGSVAVVCCNQTGNSWVHQQLHFGASWPSSMLETLTCRGALALAADFELETSLCNM